MSDVQQRIDELVKGNEVVLFMKGSASFPMCGFSGRAVQILKACGVDPKQLKTVNVLDDAEIRQGIKEYSNWPTIPQLYVKGEFVGGCDIVREMHANGELEPTLENRRKITRLIREWNADLVLGPRTNDYHPDHRYTGVLVQDAAFMVRACSACPASRRRRKR